MYKISRRVYPKEFTNSYWCPECGKLVNVTCARSIHCDIEHDGEIEIMSANVDLHINCIKCDSYMLPIDYMISKQIKQLNDAGVKTMYCCAGHLNMVPTIDNSEKVYKYNINSPYISFANIPENEYCKFIVKHLLGFQEFGFIDIEENDETWVVRAQINSIETFSDIRNGFLLFIDSIILNFDEDSFKSYTNQINTV